MEHKNFIANRIADDIASGRTPKIVLRFPPEPNGYLHLGHAKSIVLHDLLAEEFDAELTLRFDDTNPKKESTEYVDAISHDAAWLTPRFSRTRWTSAYFEDIHRCAVHLIERGLAYVDDSDPETMRLMRGDFGRGGTASPGRALSIPENLALFARMRAGEMAEGAAVLRARIDLVHPNMNLRDPVLYRVSHAEHHATGKDWPIYPMYDFAHPIADALEGVTHSLCTLEFEDHRPLYDWVIEHCFAVLGARPVQIEFARLEVEGIVLSKRKLNALVESGHVAGWDSPALPTLAGLRARGYTPAVLREFAVRCGFTKANSTVPAETMAEVVRDILSPVASRRMAVADPVEFVIDNLPESFEVEVPNHPKDTSFGTRRRLFTAKLWIDRADIRTEAEPDFWRVYPGNWVRLKHGLNVLIKAVETEDGKIVRVVSEADIGSRDLKAARHKAKTAIHWLSDAESFAVPAQHYGPLLDVDGECDVNCVTRTTMLVERGLEAPAHYEFERLGYFYFAEGILHHLASLKTAGARTR
ncbi:glutaminyl-tRNA synthetase [Janthinobacterium sp. TND4EL3]|uniref:glutamine--tRNA ligase n=1 Tax=Janthinobacterium sp. TND4EL3 TaxID=1907311 RepID=UPI0009542D9F|nr:glutamine--tRNA ligase [Janthinobacterium sp. TND4EL3]SIR90146.1 glutaminyl-tRNA synthetase [Janthinobacterium sp. TND4EL3]